MAEAALVLCLPTPSGAPARSRPASDSCWISSNVRDLAGKDLVEGWQPVDLLPRMEKMAQHSRGEIERAPWNVEPGERQVTDALATIRVVDFSIGIAGRTARSCSPTRRRRDQGGAARR